MNDIKNINLVATTTPQQRVKEYLEQNASDVLVDKINNGVLIEKDGKRLINKKTLDGFMTYATEEARKQAEKNARCACVESSIVFGWAIHYFEEDSIEGTLYNEDGTEYIKPKAAPKKTPKNPPEITPKQEEKKITPKSDKPTPKAKQNQAEQISLFDFME